MNQSLRFRRIQKFAWVSSNLATSFAQNGSKVLLMDCDMRKGRLHKIFNIVNDRATMTVLSTYFVKINESVSPFTGVPSKII